MSGLTGYYVSTRDEPRVRRAADAARLAVGAVLVFLAYLGAERTGGLEAALTDAAEAMPGWANTVFWLGYHLAAIYVIVALIGLIARPDRDLSGVGDVVLSVVGAAVLAGFVMQAQEGMWPPFDTQFGFEEPSRLFPMVRVAIVTAAVLAIAPYVTRPLRRFGSSMVVAAVVSSFFLGFGDVGAAAAGLGIGLLVGGAVHLIWGSPNGYPDVQAVASALGELDIDVRNLALMDDQSWGARRMMGTEEGGQPLAVKAYGRDASDSQLAAKAWRSLWYRDTGAPLSYSRLQSVEHEALAMLFAQRAGVPTAEPLAAATAGDDVAILAIRQPDEAFTAADKSDTELVSVWKSVAALHRADIAHGGLRLDAIRESGGSHVFTDFGASSLAAGDRRRLDVVELLFSLSGEIGIERAVATAHDGLGREALTETLPFMQLPALSRAGRRAITKPKAKMKELRAAAAEATETELPEPIKLRRVTVKNLLMLGLILLATYGLISALGGIDFAAVWEEVRDANWVVLLFALPIAHIAFLFEATGMIAAVGQPLPLRPVTVLQISARFVGLAVPSAAGRIAMNTAFLLKFGVSATVAVVQGAIDGVSGFLVEAVILLLAFLLSDASFSLGGDTDWQTILVVALVVVVIGVAVVFTVRKIREKVISVLKEGSGAVWAVFKDPKRAINLLASNLANRLILGFTLWLILRGMGVELSLTTALVVTVATNLLAGLVPVPGGIGVAEAVMTSWLVLVGVPESTALAATVIYRLWTFYIPAGEGLPAMRWLERRDYL